jgi:hypothetical protein
MWLTPYVTPSAHAECAQWQHSSRICSAVMLMDRSFFSPILVSFIFNFLRSRRISNSSASPRQPRSETQAKGRHATCSHCSLTTRPPQISTSHEITKKIRKWTSFRCMCHVSCPHDKKYDSFMSIIIGTVVVAPGIPHWSPTRFTGPVRKRQRLVSVGD